MGRCQIQQAMGNWQKKLRIFVDTNCNEILKSTYRYSNAVWMDIRPSPLLDEIIYLVLNKGTNKSIADPSR